MANKIQVAKLRTELALREFKHFLPLVTTLDEATHRKAKWPTELEYLTVIADELQYGKDRMLWVPKSRRMMATWVVSTFALWEVLRKDNYLALIQSQTEEHSKDLLEDRIKLMWENLPRWFRFFAAANEPDWTKLDVRFRDRDSRVKVFPQGPKQLRQYTPSFILVDEACHQDQFEESLTAMIPFLEKDTRIIILSSVAPSFFADTAYSERANEPVTLYPGNDSLPPERRKGIRKWNLLHGGAVLELHYSADPTKDMAWLMEKDKEVAGGIDGAQWRQEMELEKDAFSGQRIYEHFSRIRHVEKKEIPKGAKRWLSSDYGVAAPTVGLGIAQIDMSEYGPVYYVYKEFYQTGTSIENLKHFMRLKFGPSEQFESEWIDPSTDWIREKDSRTQLWLFNNGKNARSFQLADTSPDGIVLIGEWFHQGRLFIDPECTHLIYELENYRFQRWATEKQEKAHNPKEKPIKKDDHGCDALKYFANGVRWDELPEEQEDETLSEIQMILDQLEQMDNPLMNRIDPIF